MDILILLIFTVGSIVQSGLFNKKCLAKAFLFCYSVTVTLGVVVGTE